MPKYFPSLEERKLKMFEDVCATCGDGGEGGDGAASSLEGGGDETTNPDNLMKALKMLGKKKRQKK